ncbi:hypothetical protein [Serinicoccus sp. LYQ131]|uniref:hypothetical protein n=1 Tax=Serinicoccus sp. LYQ131 TaxID=3378797 RepID=UPI003852EF08
MTEEEPVPPDPPPGPLLVVTGAELAVLERAHLRGLAGAGEQEAREPGDTPEARPLAEARRSLLGRGLIDEDGHLGRSAPAALAELLLDVRLAARTLVIVERIVAGHEHRPDLRILHLVPEGGVVQDVHPQGLHGLDLHVNVDALVQAALAPVLPSDARAGQGAVRHVDPARPELVAAVLEQPGVLAELTLAGADGERVEAYLLAVGRAGCFLARRPQPPDRRPPDGQSPNPQPPDAQPELAFAPVSPGDVQDLVTRWVQETVHPGG